MRNMLKVTIKLLLVVLLLGLTACGGGGGGGGGDAPPVQTQEQAVINLTLSGGSDTIGSVQFELLLPEGFTFATDGQDQLEELVLTTTLPAGSIVTSNYFPEDAQNFGQLNLALISAEGFQPGDFVSLVKDLAVGEAIPLSSDFWVNNLLVTDVINAVELTGYSIDISVQQQTATP